MTLDEEGGVRARERRQVPRWAAQVTTPAARRLDAFLDAYNSGELDSLLDYAAAASEPEALGRSRVTAWHAARQWQRVYEAYGPIEPLGVLLSLDHRLVVRGRTTRDGLPVRLDIGVMPDAPHRVYQLAMVAEREPSSSSGESSSA